MKKLVDEHHDQLAALSVNFTGLRLSINLYTGGNDNIDILL